MRFVTAISALMASLAGCTAIDTSKSESDRMELRLYDVSDQVIQCALCNDFPSGGSISIAHEHPGQEDRLDRDDFVERLVEQVAPGRWDKNGLSILIQNGLLVVQAPTSVHQALEKHLGIGSTSLED